MEQSTSPDISVNQYFNVVVEPKRCPKCSSVYINEFECEACSYQFKKSRVGNPFSHKNSYQLEEDFNHEHRLWSNLSSFLPSKIMEKLSLTKILKRKLFTRYKALLHHLFENAEGSREDRKLFFIELNYLAQRLLELGTSREQLLALIDHSRVHPELEKLKVTINFTMKKGPADGPFNIKLYLILFSFFIFISFMAIELMATLFDL